MKNYKITVNGNEYEVAVEEITNAPVVAAAPKQVSKPVESKPVAPKAPAAPKGAQGAVKITSPMPGKIVGVKASQGTAVKRGQVVIVLEAMKMENEIVAPQDGTIAGINVSVGQSVEAGDILASLN